MMGYASLHPLQEGLVVARTSILDEMQHSRTRAHIFSAKKRILPFDNYKETG
jgi:hypothetical protein